MPSSSNGNTAIETLIRARCNSINALLSQYTTLLSTYASHDAHIRQLLADKISFFLRNITSDMPMRSPLTNNTDLDTTTTAMSANRISKHDTGNWSVMAGHDTTVSMTDPQTPHNMLTHLLWDIAAEMAATAGDLYSVGHRRQAAIAHEASEQVWSAAEDSVHGRHLGKWTIDQVVEELRLSTL